MCIVNALLMKCELFCDCVHTGPVQRDRRRITEDENRILCSRNVHARDGLQLTCRSFFFFDTELLPRGIVISRAVIEFAGLCKYVK